MIRHPAVDPTVRHSKRRWSLWVGGALLFLIIVSTAVWTVVGAGSGAGRPSTARLGSPAPEVQLPQLVDAQPSTKSRLTLLTGHPLVVNFWATWCAPCRAEFPAFESKYRQYKDSNQLVILGIDAESDAGAAAAQQFVNQFDATFPVWLDTDGTAEQVYRVQALPTTIFIDRGGVIQDMIVGGPLSEDNLEKELKRIF